MPLRNSVRSSQGVVTGVCLTDRCLLTDAAQCAALENRPTSRTNERTEAQYSLRPTTTLTDASSFSSVVGNSKLMGEQTANRHYVVSRPQDYRHFALLLARAAANL